jgi:hypothetical protein
MKTTLDIIYLSFFSNIKQVENLYIILSLGVKKGLLKLNNRIESSLKFLLDHFQVYFQES